MDKLIAANGGLIHIYEILFALFSYIRHLRSNIGDEVKYGCSGSVF